jgi:hypothetical protein
MYCYHVHQGSMDMCTVAKETLLCRQCSTMHMKLQGGMYCTQLHPPAVQV